MQEKSVVTTNKYGKVVMLPPTTNTKPCILIENILREIGAIYATEFYFDVTGLRQTKYDFAIFKSNDDELPVVLLEYDGAAHYATDFYENTGVRPERAKAHVVRSNIRDLKKAQIAMKYNIPVIRLDDHYINCMRDYIISILAVYVDGFDNKNNEIVMIDMLEKYGWDFEYVHPSDMSKAEKERYEKYLEDHDDDWLN